MLLIYGPRLVNSISLSYVVGLGKKVVKFCHGEARNGKHLAFISPIQVGFKFLLDRETHAKGASIAWYKVCQPFGKKKISSCCLRNGESG